jgi:hypothetical protein
MFLFLFSIPVCAITSLGVPPSISSTLVHVLTSLNILITLTFIGVVLWLMGSSAGHALH